MIKKAKTHRRISEVRHANFLVLLREFAAQHPGRGMLTRFSEKVGIKANYLVQVRAGNKPLGPKTAQTIEKALGRPHGWLDETHDELELLDAAERMWARAMLQHFRSKTIKEQELLLSRLKEIERLIDENKFPFSDDGKTE